MNLPEKVRCALGAWFHPNTRVVAAFSGGLDSVVLLDILTILRQEVPFTLMAMHVHHGLSPKADQWADFCQQFCESRAVPLTIQRVRLPDTTGKGLERVAREARYSFLAKAEADVICCAHHRDDQAETVLLTLFRGSGIHGLAAMPVDRAFSGKRLLRPLLDVPRGALRAWAEQRGLAWVEDESNENLNFRRNHVRHTLLPEIQQQFPGVVQVLARTAWQMSEQGGLLDRLAQQDTSLCTDKGILRASLLATLPAPAARNVLRYLLLRQGIRVPGQARLESFVAQLPNARNDAAIQVALGDAVLHVWRDVLWLDLAATVPLPPSTTPEVAIQRWPDGTLETGWGGTLPGDWSVVPTSTLANGQHFRPLRRARGVLSELLRASDIPAWVRWRLPAVRHEGVLCWVAGLGWAEEYAKVSQCVRIAWQPNGRGTINLTPPSAAEN